jgi:ribosomal protein L7Ae-like RNA K-turn-binding protein
MIKRNDLFCDDWDCCLAMSIRGSQKLISCEIPHYLKTMWTSKKADEFSDFLTVLDGVLKRPSDESDPKSYVIGFKETFRILEKNSSSVLCVLACVDNGHDTSAIPRLSWICHEAGVPLILGRDCRRLGKIFQDRRIKRVGCLALTKFAAAQEELLPLVMNLSSHCSDLHLAASEDEVIQKFTDICKMEKNFLVAPKVVNKPASTPPPKKKQKTVKTSFFSNFD